MRALLVQPQITPLTGTVEVPGDKSISHRAVILAAIADGQSVIRNWLPAGDTLATLDCMRALGVPIETRGDGFSWELTVDGRGLRGLRRPAVPLDCRNAGTCIRLLAGLLAGQSFSSVLDGSAQLRRRPMRRVCQPLRLMGGNIQDHDGRAPLTIEPAPLRGLEYRMEVASAQVKSALLLAGLYAEGETRIHQPATTRDHTERMLQAMGLAVYQADNWIILPADTRKLAPLDIIIPGDISSAAFPLVAAAIVPHSQVTMANVGVNETRTGLLELLAAMGGRCQVSQSRLSGDEPVADLTMGFDELHSTEAGGDLVVRAIDELPVWAVAASQAAGVSVVRDAAELRVKEVDRISLLATELRRMGVVVEERPDGFTIAGPVRLRGAEVDCHGDHRLGMALAVAGLAADSPTLIRDAACIADSFPGFAETLRALGARTEWLDTSHPHPNPLPQRARGQTPPLSLGERGGRG
ncbi:MAG: 3-phosphoshikimate 1-carboxyvinyltransferase [Chloroflexota bacterium]